MYNIFITCFLGKSAKIPRLGEKHHTINKYVSITQHNSTTRLLRNMKWVPFIDRTRQSSKAWEFMGSIVLNSVEGINGGDADVPISNMLYCKLCFDEQMKADKGMLSKVYSTRVTTSSGNHLSHASAKHGAVFQKPIDVKITTWLTKAGTNSPASTQYEFNRGPISVYLY